VNLVDVSWTDWSANVDSECNGTTRVITCGALIYPPLPENAISMYLDGTEAGVLES